MPKEPTPIRVFYKGSDTTLRLTGPAPKFTEDFVFAGHVPLTIRAVPLNEDGKPISPEDGTKPSGWDRRDIDFFERKAKNNPDTWEIVPSAAKRALEKAKAVLKGKGKKAETAENADVEKADEKTETEEEK